MVEEHLIKESGEKVKVSRKKTLAITRLTPAINRHDGEINCDAGRE